MEMLIKLVCGDNYLKLFLDMLLECLQVCVLGAVHKRHPQSGVCPVRTRGVLQMQTSAFFGAKHIGFFEIYGASARTRGGRLSQYVSTDILRTRGKGSIFAILFGRRLWTASYLFSFTKHSFNIY